MLASVRSLVPQNKPGEPAKLETTTTNAWYFFGCELKACFTVWYSGKTGREGIDGVAETSKKSNDESVCESPWEIYIQNVFPPNLSRRWVPFHLNRRVTTTTHNRLNGSRQSGVYLMTLWGQTQVTRGNCPIAFSNHIFSWIMFSAGFVNQLLGCDHTIVFH